MRIFRRLFQRTQQQRVVAPSSTVQPDAENYCARCFARNYIEEDETRSSDSDPAFRHVLDPLNEGLLGKGHEKYAVACEEAKKLVDQVNDFHGVYDWWGSALIEMDDLKQARKVFLYGLEKSKRKFPLCEMLGRVEWKAGNVKEAVYWWAQGLHCQESLSEINYGGEQGSYLYLYYVADGVGLPDCASAFLMRADQIRSGEIRLKSELVNDLRSLSRSAKNTEIPEVLKKLVASYIVPEKKKSSTPADAAEVNRLIAQLEEVGNLKRWSEDKDIVAAKRLGELADPRAIEVLTKVAKKGMMLDVMEAAKEAIKKIKEANR